jgi:hypothetical protein
VLPAKPATTASTSGAGIGPIACSRSMTCRKSIARFTGVSARAWRGAGRGAATISMAPRPMTISATTT